MGTAATTGPPGRPSGWPLYPVIYGMLAWTAPQLLAGMPGWTTAAVGVGVAAVGVGLVRATWPAEWFSRGFTTSASWFAVALSAATAAWLWLANGDPVPVWRWLVLGVALAGGWFAVLVWRAPAWAAATAAADRVDVPDVAEVALGGVYATILRRAGVLPGCRIVRVETSPSGGVDTVHLVPVRHAGRRVMTFAQVIGKADAIATEAALGLAEERGIEIDNNDVNFERMTSASYRVHFTVKRVLEGDVPYVIRTEPRGPHDLMRIGQYETDARWTSDLCPAGHGAAHMDLLAGTDGGKTTVMHNHIAEDLACDSWLVWVFASRKLLPVAWPWLRSWVEGRTDRPVLNAVFGESHDEILRGLIYAMRLAKTWNRQIGDDPVRVVTPARRGLTIYLDEAGDFLKNPKKVTFDLCGELREMSASEMVAELSEVARTSPIKICRAFQNGLMGTAGKAGSEARRNFLTAVVGRTTAAQDARQVAPGLPISANVTKLRNNMVYVQPNLEEPTVLRAKAGALFGRRVDAVAVAYAKWCGDLDATSAALLDDWDQRWAPEHHPQLVEYAKSQGLTWPTTPPTADTDPATTEPTTDEAPAAPVPATVPDAEPASQPAVQEEPMPETWSDEDAAWLTSLGLSLDDPAPEEAIEGAPSILANPDTSEIGAALGRMSAQQVLVAQLARLPEPLGRVLAHMLHPRAQAMVETGWVPTEVLAISLGRCKPGDDDDTRRRAAEQLGRDLTATDPTGRLTSVQRRLGVGVRMRGFLVDDLRELGERLGGTDGTDPRHGTGGTDT